MEDATYLWVAETVLRKHRRPLNARALVNYGLEDGLFPASGLSRTPQKSMQARLSIDILANRSSLFFRTGRGKFFLKDMMPESPDESFEVYTAARRLPIPSSERVLCIPEASYQKFAAFQGIAHLGKDNPIEALSRGDILYIPRTTAEICDEFKQVITYTIIQYKSKILTFRRGLYNRAANFLRGAQCVGFGGHVNEDDLDLFSMADWGVRQNAAREISEELVLPDGRPQIDPSEFEFLGILNDDSSSVGVRHLAVVLRYWVDDWSKWRSVTKGEASINRLKWLDTFRDSINLSDFEYWSQLVIRNLFKSSMSMVPSYKIMRKSAFHGAHILCVVGSIGSGKSATSRLFAEKFGYVNVNSGQVLSGLLGIPPIPETPRDVFQDRAEVFINQANGPKLLGEALAAAALNSCAQRVLIDGIRHPETLEALRSAANKAVALLYVYTPPDVAFEMYRYREQQGENSISFRDFVNLYNAPVESKIRYLIGEADIITFNWMGLEEYGRLLTELMEILNVE